MLFYLSFTSSSYSTILTSSSYPIKLVPQKEATTSKMRIAIPLPFGFRVNISTTPLFLFLAVFFAIMTIYLAVPGPVKQQVARRSDLPASVLAMTTFAPAIAVDINLAHTVIGEVAHRLPLRREVYVVEVIQVAGTGRTAEI